MSTTYETCQAYYFKHTARYVRFDFAAWCDAGGKVYFKAVDSLSNPTTLGYYETTLDEQGIGGGSNFDIDLGTPDGTLKSVFLQMKSGAASKYGWARTTRQYLHD